MKFEAMQVGKETLVWLDEQALRELIITLEYAKKKGELINTLLIQLGLDKLETVSNWKAYRMNDYDTVAALSERAAIVWYMTYYAETVGDNAIDAVDLPLQPVPLETALQDFDISVSRATTIGLSIKEWLERHGSEAKPFIVMTTEEG